MALEVLVQPSFSEASSSTSICGHSPHSPCHWDTGQVVTMSEGMHCRKLPRQALWHSWLSSLLGFVILTTRCGHLQSCCYAVEALDF